MTQLTYQTPTRLENLLDPINDADAANKRYVDARVGGSVFSKALQPLISTDVTAFTNNAIEGVGNTVLYVNNDASVILPIGTFIGFLNDPNAYVITSVVVVPPVPPATQITSVITIGSPLAILVAQNQSLYKYRLNSSTFQNIVFDDAVLVTNANGTLYVQSKYKPLYGTTIPTNGTLGYFGQTYLQDVSTQEKKIFNLWVSITPIGTTEYTWIEIFGGGGGLGAIFGSTSVIAKNFSAYTTQPNVPGYIPTDSPNRLFGVSPCPTDVTTNEFSENTGEGTIKGVRYIGSQSAFDPNLGNGLLFPTDITPDSDISFELTIDVLSFNTTFTTALTSGNAFVEFMIASSSIIAALQNPINQAIQFFNGGIGEERYEWKQYPTVTVVGNTVTLRKGVAVIKGDFNNTNYIGSNNPFYLFLAVSDISSGTNACTSMSGVQLSTDKTLCSYSLDMYIGLQGQSGGGAGGSTTVTSTSLVVSGTPTGVDIEVPTNKAIPVITTATTQQVVQFIDGTGIQQKVTINKNNTANADPISTGGVGTPTVGYLGDFIFNTQNSALWLQVIPPAVPPAVQTYSWIRVNTSTAAGVTSFNARTGAIVAQAGTNIRIDETPNGTFTIFNTGTSPANPLGITSGLQLPASGLGQIGDLYLYLNQSATPYILLQKSGNAWASNNVLTNMAQNNTVQLFENQCLQDLFDAELYPDLNVVDNVATILDNANTTFILSYINLYVTVVRTALSDTDVGILTDNIISGQVLQADGAGTIGTWRFIVTAVNITGTSGNKTATILGHLKTSDTQSLTSLNTATGVIKSLDGSTLRFNGAGLFTDCFVPDLDGNYLGFDPVAKKITFLALPTPPTPPTPPANVQSYSLSVDGNGTAGTVLFDTIGATLGTQFGTMVAGVFTVSRAVTCRVNLTLNLSGNPDGDGAINNNFAGKRYNQYNGTATKISVSQIVPFASGDNYRWQNNGNIIVYGGLTLGTTIEFEALN